MNLPLPVRVIFFKIVPAGKCRWKEQRREGCRSPRPVGYFHGPLLCAKRRWSAHSPLGALARKMTKNENSRDDRILIVLCFPAANVLCSWLAENPHHDAGRSQKYFIRMLREPQMNLALCRPCFRRHGGGIAGGKTQGAVLVVLSAAPPTMTS